MPWEVDPDLRVLECANVACRKVCANVLQMPIFWLAHAPIWRMLLSVVYVKGSWHGMCILGMGILGLSDFVEMFWTWYFVFQASCLLCKEPSHIPLRCEEVEKVCPYALHSFSLVYVSVCNIFKDKWLPSWMTGSHIHITKLLIKGKKVDKLSVCHKVHN